MSSTFQPKNTTEISISTTKYYENLRITIIVLIVICLCFFTYGSTIILSAFFTKPYIRETPRYILFAHMLINDAVYLAFSLFLVIITTVTTVLLPGSLCYIIVIVSSTSFKISPYNLGVMALERYVAICYPLRHNELCTRRRSVIAIVFLWIIGLVPFIADFIILCSSVDRNYFSLYVVCARASFLNTPLQNTIRSFVHAMSFSLVGLIILFTYVKIMMVAKRINSGKESASKAAKTVILHCFQLLLCLLAFTYPITEMYFKEYLLVLPIMNYLLLMCLPRVISPLIYGIRDEAFQKNLKRFMLCGRFRIRTNAEE